MYFLYLHRWSVRVCCSISFRCSGIFWISYLYWVILFMVIILVYAIRLYMHFCIGVLFRIIILTYALTFDEMENMMGIAAICFHFGLR